MNRSPRNHNLKLIFLLMVQRDNFGLYDLEDLDCQDDLDSSVISLLTDEIEKIKKENLDLNNKQAHIQVPS